MQVKSFQFNKHNHITFPEQEKQNIKKLKFQSFYEYIFAKLLKIIHQNPPAHKFPQIISKN